MNELPETVQSNGSPGGRSTADQLSMIENDRERRWAGGDRVPVEEYLAAHPSLAEGEAAVGLIYGEFRLRVRLGESPSIEEYQRRFPVFAQRLAEQFEAYREFCPEVSTETRVSTAHPAIPVQTRSVPTVPGFEIIDELGRGGMAVVYRARDTRLNRIVALKVIKAATLPDETEIGRFRTEAEAVAQLRHPHIVQIFEVGDAGGMPFMALEFLPGGTLAHKLREHPLSSRAAAEMTERLARAVEVAHRAGVIHRDLKPGNVLLAEDGSPRVADFGLAKRTDAPDGHTHIGAILGTPSYMSPEQASGRALGPATDVYALGAILYECLTGRPPFRESSVVETLAQVCTRDPVPPSRLLLRVPSELEAVCLKCLEKDPVRRYAGAAELADDLRRWLDGKPTLARPVGLAGRVWKLVRRNPVISTATAVSVLALVIGGVTAAWFQIEATKENAARVIAELDAKLIAADLLTEQANHVLTKEREETGRRANYSRLLGVADRFWLANAPALSEEALDQCPPDLREGEWHYRRHRNNPVGTAFGADWDLEILCSAVSADGKFIVTGGGNSNSPDQPGHVGIWDASTGQRAFTLSNPVAGFAAAAGGMATPALKVPHTGPLRSVAFQPNRPTLVTASRRTDVLGMLRQEVPAFADLRGEVAVWDVPTRNLRQIIPGATGPVAFSAGGTRFVACAKGRIARVWDVNGSEWKELPALPAYPGRIGAVALSPDGSWLAVAGYHVSVFDAGNAQMTHEFGIYDLATGKKKPDSPDYKGAVECVAFSPDGQTLVAGCLDGAVRQWDVATGRQGPTLRGHTNAINAIAFSAGGKWLATAGRDQAVKVWDWQLGAEVSALRGHDRPVQTVAFFSTANGERLVSAGSDGTVRIWNPTREAGRLDLAGHDGMTLSVALSPDRPLLASISRKDGKVRVWDSKTGRQLFAEKSGTCEKVAFGAGGLFATAGGLRADTPGELIVWDVATGKPKFTLAGHKKFVTAIAFSPDGRRLASAAGDGFRSEAEEVKVWDTETGKELFAFRPAVRIVSALAFSPDGKRLAAGGNGRAVAVCDAETGRELRLLPDYPGNVLAVAFSPDGRTLATGDYEGFLTFRDAEDGRERLRVRAHRTAIHAVSFEPSGRRLASASFDMSKTGVGEVRVWDTRDGREVLELPGELCVAFSADGRKLAAPARGAILGAGASHAVHVWDFSPSPLDATLRTSAKGMMNVATDSTGRFLAASDSEGNITVWDRTKREVVQTIKCGQDAAGLDFSPDASRLASGEADGTIRVWDIATGKCIKTLVGHAPWVSRVKFDTTGTRLISGGFDGTVRVWGIEAEREVFPIDHPARVQDIALSPDGRLAAVCGGKSVQVFDPATGKRVHTMPTTDSTVSAAFGPGGLAVGENGGTIRLWDTNNWTERGQFKGHRGTVCGVAFGPNNILYSAGVDRTVRVWSVEDRSQLAVFVEHTELVRAVVARDGWLATAGYDGAVRIWDPGKVLP